MRFHLDALHAEKAIRNRLVDLARSECYLQDKHLADACEALWRSQGTNEGLVGPLWVEPIFPPKPSTVKLSEITSMSADLLQQLNASNEFPIDRELYSHQSEAIEHES